ncbi:MAG: GGDEF domain-containing protein [Butyrivibrio sp.]|nr:GGDEF domain-containing protein [Butyrivibrio sp.]
MRIEDYDNEVIKLNQELMEERSRMSKSLIAICNRFVRKAKQVDDTNLLGYAFYYLADAYYMISTDYRKFNTNLLKAMEYLQTCGDNEHLARCYNLLGIDALNHGNPELGLDFFLTGLKYCEELDKNSEIPGLIQFNIGQIYYNNGDAKEALQYVRSAYKNIRKNRKGNLYYRNLLFCYCFQADCYMDLGKKESLKHCLDGIDQLEQDRSINREYFSDLPILDIRMRGYHYLGETALYEKNADMLSYLIQNNKFPLDSMEDIFRCCRFFIRTGRVGEVLRIIKNTERSLNDLNIPYLKRDHAKLKVELFQKLDREKELNEALYEFYNMSLAQEKEKIANYKFFMSIRNRLSTMEKENLMLMKQAETDPLTGLGNRYGLNNYADKAFEGAYAEQKSLAVEILDVDNFKHFNDNYGHYSGDKCLTMIADAIARKCNDNPAIHAFRYGGDEFVLIYENMTDAEVMGHAMDLRNEVLAMKIVSEDGKRSSSVTISQGIRNSIPSETNKLWDYMYAADNALYEVKGHQKGEVALLHKAVISQKSLSEAQHS